MLSQKQLADWERDGFIVLRGFANRSIGEEMAAETIDAIRADLDWLGLTRDGEERQSRRFALYF